jgi:hypothetical protein
LLPAYQHICFGGFFVDDADVDDVEVPANACVAILCSNTDTDEKAVSLAIFSVWLSLLLLYKLSSSQ